MNRRVLLIASALAGAAPAPALAATAPKSGSAAADPFLRLPTLTATVTRRDGRRGVLTVEVGVHAPDPEVATRAAQSAPRLRAAFNEVVRAIGAGLLPGAVPDVERLSRELQIACDQALGRPGGRVLLGTLMAV